MEATRNTDFAVHAATPAASGRMPILLVALTILTVLGIAVGLYMGLVAAGTDVEQGNVQRIFYVHLASFAGAFVAFIGTVIGGAAYLRTRSPKWDALALAGVEVGMVLALINLVTGSIWARPIWNTWWNWDPRLTADAIMILTYAAYLMLRGAIENVETRRRFAAVYGILAFTTVIVTLMITRVVPSTIHPVVIGPTFTGTEMNAVGGFELNATAGVSAAAGFNSAVWSILVPITLMWHRIRLENLAERVNALKLKVLSE